VCDVTGGQELTKIAATSDGGCYISWFDNRSGSYAVYLQRLNAQGVKQFAADGLLISSNPQSSSLVDYDLIADDSNNAVIVFTDTRNGSVINPFAYKINPAGSFMWGANGISLTDSAGVFQANPRVTQTSDGSYVVAWVWSSTPNKVAMQKLNNAGVKQWNGGNPVRIASSISNESFTFPALVRSDNGSVIMLWSGYTGTFIVAANYKLYTQKFSSSGTGQWTLPQDTIYNGGNVPGTYVPRLVSDGNNGALYAWHDDRSSSNLRTAYVQRVNSAGVKQFPPNGSAGSIAAGLNKFDPAVAFNPATNETYMFWRETNSLQSQIGVLGQKFSANGTRQWGDNGMVYKPLDQNSLSSLNAYVYGGSAYVYYNEILFGGTNCLVKAFKVNGSTGSMTWGLLTASSAPSEKIRLASAISSFGHSMLSWTDRRNDGGGIYAQNIDKDGNMGGPNGIQNSGVTPAGYKLEQNYPNPFNPSTNLEFKIADAGSVKLTVYDMTGKEVQTLLNGNLNAGTYNISFDGSKLSSGVYYYELKARDFKEIKKMVLVK
jgi:hypothetical protein